MDRDGDGIHGDLALLRQALAPLIGDVNEDAIREIEASGTWVSIPGGRRLIRVGDPADAMYLVVRGRLRASVPAEDGSVRTIGEVARGEAVGEMGLLGGERRNADIDAIRDCRLLRLGEDAFRDLAARHPEFLWNLARTVVRRIGGSPGSRRGVPPVRTIAVVGSVAGAARERFVRRLAAALEPHGATAVVDAREARATAAASGGAAGLAAWLDERETRHRFVLASDDPADPEWTRFLMRQADRVLVACDASDDPHRDDLRRWTAAGAESASHARRDLVLLHPDGSRSPRDTAAWLDAHEVGRVHHVREDRDGDVERLARFLAGRAVAIVFAGGGAKGFAHAGIVRALREEGVPIDLVGGTSIGAILGATVALDWDERTRMDNLRGAFVATNPGSDFRIPPIVSLVKGGKMERQLRRYCGENDIEDLWLPFFCVSSDVSAGEKRVHTRGPLWRALRASASIAGVFPPAVIDGHLHVDGGTFDNMPVETARDLDAGHVIACDFHRATQAAVPYERIPSTRALLADRWLRGRRRRRYRVPGLMTLMMQTTFLAGIERARASARDADLFLEPVTARIPFLGWSALDRAVEIGHAYARETLADPEVRARLDAIVRPRRASGA